MEIMRRLGNKTQEQRFWSLVEKDGHKGCWVWQGSRQNGYGKFNGRSAHRVSYTLIWGAIPEGRTLDHLCTNTLCVNPWHLEPVTRKVNSQRNATRNLLGGYRNINRVTTARQDWYKDWLNQFRLSACVTTQKVKDSGLDTMKPPKYRQES